MWKCGRANSFLEFDGTISERTTYYLHRLDLRPSLDALYKGFHKDLHPAEDQPSGARITHL